MGLGRAMTEAVDGSGAGSPQNVPPLSGSQPLGQALPRAVRKELEATAPVVIDTASTELADGANRCPGCGSSEIGLKPGADVLVCQHCGKQWEGERVEELFEFGEGIADLKGTVIASGARDIVADTTTLMTFKCTGCGAEVTINTENAMTARCHWCRHVFGVNEQIDNGAVPDAVLPFHIKKDDAVARIRQFVGKRRLFALKEFKAQFTPENVIGVYLPYMIVDGNVSVDIAGEGEIKTFQYTSGSGNDERTYYDADIYRVERHVDFTVDDLPLESSSKRGNLDTRVNTNNIINTILPFDTKNAVKWNASYLSGFSSEKRNSNIEHLQPRLEDQLLSIARAQIASSVSRYDRGIRWEQEKLDVHGSRWVSMYLPVWLYSYQQPGKNRGMLHYIAVNGRTGETMGSVPVQQWKLLLVAITAGTIIEAIVFAIQGEIFMLKLSDLFWLLLPGTVGATVLYRTLHRYYRNTDKSHGFERETTVEVQRVTGSDKKTDKITGTQRTRIDGDNVYDYRVRVRRFKDTST